MLPMCLMDAGRTGARLIRPSVEWANANITKRNPRFRFFHFDVRDELHNPNGTLRPTEIRLPCDDQSADLIIAQSVFTHMLIEDVEYYLSEIARVLRPSGAALVTCFLVNRRILRSARATNRTPFDLRFEHRIGDSFINDPARPLGAVELTKRRLQRAIRSASPMLGVSVSPSVWSGHFPNALDGQDVLVLSRAADGSPHSPWIRLGAPLRSRTESPSLAERDQRNPESAPGPPDSGKRNRRTRMRTLRRSSPYSR